MLPVLIGRGPELVARTEHYDDPDAPQDRYLSVAVPTSCEAPAVGTDYYFRC